ncbi:MAG: low affinity iron permease family protein [Dehalococcoidia bacterium]
MSASTGPNNGRTAAPRVHDETSKHGLSDLFRKAAHRTSVAVGSPVAFLAAFLVVLLWAVSGPIFKFADTWQLVINTGTTIVTFLMVFLIQNTQNRDSRALHMKLDELILYTKGADNEMVELENLSDEQMDALEAHFHALAKRLGRDDVLDEEDEAADDEAAETDNRRKYRRRVSADA